MCAPPASAAFVTVVFLGDLRLFAIQLASLERFVDPEGFAEFSVFATSDAAPAVFSAVLRRLVNRHMGPAWRRRTHVERRPLALTAGDGYRRQQLLKLWAAARTTARLAVVLDAKNSFVSPCCAADLWSSGKPRLACRTGSEEGDEGWGLAVATASRFWCMSPTKGQPYAAPFTPFVLLPGLARDMMSEAAERLAGPGAPPDVAWEGFASSPKLALTTEFIWYSQYVISRYGSLDAVYTVGHDMSATLFGSLRPESRDLRLLRAAGPGGTPVIGIDRRRVGTLDQALLSELARLWSPLGLDPQRALGLKKWRRLNPFGGTA